MNRFVLISGCSGGGKSTLVAALAAEGVSTVEEPGRRIVSASLASDGQGLPWADPAGFAARAVELALEDWQAAHETPGPVVFDRGLVDAVAAYEHATGALPTCAVGLGTRYNPQILVLPPWPEIWQQDAERQHDFGAAVEEYERLVAFYPRFGYSVTEVPRAAVADRVAFVRAQLQM